MKLAQEYQGRVDIVKMNYADKRMRAVVAEYGADVHPAFVFLLPDGRRDNILLGEVGESELRKDMDRLVSETHPGPR